ncbi:MAG: penicillin acylase family protein [Candidatus Aminicenantes bacterium]|nr:MAG: penicillin acylase family protein [Candidatus Aminicenantes bacterium]
MKKFFKISIISVLSLLLGFLVFLLIHVLRSTPQMKGEILLDGLREEVRIVIDAWGVPHIFAQNEKDLFFACGFMHAHERMWQMEITRRAGFGRLSEVFGKVALDRDKFMRGLSLAEGARRDYDKLSPKMKELIVSYSEGINSWMDTRKMNWPLEFLILRYRPQPWTPLDSLVVKEIMALMLCTDYRSEVVRGNLVKRLGAEKALQILEEGIPFPSPGIEEARLSNGVPHIPFQGSNNWVVSGRRTESGKPLLANDPHLEISLPSIWYEIHLSSPDVNVTGVSLPGVPFVIIGHNESIAWGTTNSGVDVQDLYVEKLNDTGDMYLDKGEWKPLFKKRENIKVRGKRLPEEIEISWTERGPIISPFVIESQSPLSLGWTIYDGGESMKAFYLLNRAQNWQEFKSALGLFDVPSQNFVYADKDGNIGYYLSGKIPIRPAAAALFPFPGWREEGQWKGYLDEEQKPHLFNPEEGMVVTANNKITPEGFPHYVGFDWFYPFRAERIRELLFQKEKHSIESFKIIQNDVYTKNGEFVLPVLDGIEGDDGKMAEALSGIRDWDLMMSSGKEPALFEFFMDFFNLEVFKDELGEDFDDFDSSFRRKNAGLLRILSDPLSSWFDNVDTASVETREEIVEVSLEKAYEWLEENYGSFESWDWMKIHSIRFRHALGEVPLFRFFNRGPFPVDGHAFTVRASFGRGHETTSGASYRQIIDLADLNNSVCVITSGQSGCFLSRFYDNQIPLWLEGRYHPMLFSPDSIERDSIGTLRLKPLARR